MQPQSPTQKRAWYRPPILLLGILVLCLSMVSCGGEAQPPTLTGPLGTTPLVQTTPPTPKPTATPSPRPRVNVVKATPAPPTPHATPAQLSLTFTQASNELVSVHTLPGAALTIKVLYACSGHDATSQSLQGTFSADGSGNYTWTWTNQSSCHGGVIAIVTSSSGGKTITSSASFSD